MKKQTKLYNVFFPVFMLLLIPTVWLIALPVNYIWDTIIILIALAVLKIKNKNEIYKNSIMRIWLFGFIADLIGATLLTVPQFFDIGIDALTDMCWEPYSNPISICIIIVGALISAFMIYLFNKKYSFNRTGLDHETKKKLAKILAICTLPYFFFVPTKTFYSINNNTDNIDSIYIEETNNYVETQNIHKELREIVRKIDNSFLDTSNKYIEYNVEGGMADITVTDMESSVYDQKESYAKWVESVMQQIKERDINLLKVEFIFRDTTNGIINYTY